MTSPDPTTTAAKVIEGALRAATRKWRDENPRRSLDGWPLSPDDCARIAIEALREAGFDV